MIDFSSFKKVSVGNISLKQLFVDGIQVFKSGYKNWVPYSINTDGSIYNGTGYKDGYRIRSGGGETENSGSRITGFIPAISGDTIRFTGWNFDHKSATNAVNFYDSSFTNLGQFTTQPSGYGICSGSRPTVETNGNQHMFTVPVNTEIRYLRVTGQHAYNTLPPEMIVTVNEEIES